MRYKLLSLLICAVIVGWPGSSQALPPLGNLINYDDFEGPQPALLPWGSVDTGRWVVESAALISGSEGGVFPKAGNGMLRLNELGGTATQVHQTIDLTGLATEIDTGLLCVRASAFFNSPTGASNASIAILAYDGPDFSGSTLLAFLSTGATTLDANIASWEALTVGSDGTFTIPVGTTHIVVQVAYHTGTFPSGGYVDSIDVEVMENSLIDNSFDSGSAALLAWGDMSPNRWVAENATLIVGTQNGVTPSDGDGMLRIDHAGGVGSQVEQSIDVSIHTGLINNGAVSLVASALYNSPTAGSDARLVATAYDGPSFSGATVLAQTSVPLLLDSDPATWETISIGSGTPFVLPAGTTHVELQMIYIQGTVPSGGYVDAASEKLDFDVMPYAGLAHNPLGQALLSSDQGALTISNIGSSGLDGVAINLARTDGYLDIGFDTSVWSNGTIADVDVYGEVAGIETLLASERYEVIGSTVSFTPDFSPSAGATYVASLALNGVIVQQPGGAQGLSGALQFPLPTGPTPDSFFIFNGKRKKCKRGLVHPKKGPFGVASFDPLMTIELPSPIMVTLPGLAPQLADLIILSPENVVIVEDSASTVEVRLNGVTDFRIVSEAIGPFRQFSHSPIGGAFFEPNATSLTVDNIQAEGLDGVLINLRDFPATVFFDVAWQVLDASGPLPLGASFGGSSTGTVGGVENQPVGTFDMTDMGAAIEATVDFSAVGSTTEKIEIYNAGVLVATVNGHSGIAATFSGWPTTLRLIPSPDQTPTLAWGGWVSPPTFTIPGGGSFVGDELRITAENASSSFTAQAELSLTSSQIPKLVILSEAGGTMMLVPSSSKASILILVAALTGLALVLVRKEFMPH